MRISSEEVKQRGAYIYIEMVETCHRILLSRTVEQREVHNNEEMA